MREAALCDRHSKQYEEHEPWGSRSFFSEIIASISDIKFSADGRYILSRDYLTLKLWDVNMESQPVATVRVHEHLRAKLCDLYENESIFDKFECCMSGNCEYVATGSYSNVFRVFGLKNGAASVGLVAPLFDQAAITAGDFDQIAKNAEKVMANVREAGPYNRKK